MKTILSTLRIFIVLTIITGVIYPLVITGAGQIFFPYQANGSFLYDASGQIIGSELIAQKFTDNKYFWPRPSAVDYNPLPSGGSNWGPTSADLKKQVEDRIKMFTLPLTPSPQGRGDIRVPSPLVGEGQGEGFIPSDLLFASASGLDPHISPEAAKYQLSRVATARSFNAEQMSRLKNLIEQMTLDRTFGILGEKRINVLQLNLTLDHL